MRQRIKSIFLLAVVYGLVGIVSLDSAIPPGYTAPIFPAAGVALMSLLLWGRQLWPGVFLGSLLVQTVAIWQSGAQGSAWIGMPLVPLAASLQALIGVRMVHRWVGWPNRLDTPRAIVNMCLKALPLSCVISAGISVPLLTLLGVFPAAEAWFNGWSWWLGDTFGGMIALPLMMAWFARPRSEWRPRVWSITLPVLVALASLVALSQLIQHWQNLRVQGQFNRDAAQLEQLVSKRLDAQMDALLSLQQMQTLAPASSEQSWQRMTAPWLERWPGTQNLGWSPLVMQRERAAFEQQQLTGHPILARDAHGHTFSSPLHPYYLPIAQIEPLQSNIKAYGLDILSSPVLSAAARASIASGHPMASGAIHLVQEQGQQRGIVVYQAVWNADHAHAGRGVLSGVLSSVFRMDDIVNSSLSGVARHDIDVCLVDQDAAPGLSRLSGPKDCERADWLGRRPHQITRFNYVGRHWSLILQANEDYMIGLRSWLEWGTFAAGLAMIGLFGGFLLILTGYTRRVETDVTERTAELGAANLQLQQQLDATRKAEAKVEYLARHDSLTGLPNRSFWLMSARHALAEAQISHSRLAVLFLDMDEFKTVNDSLGHSVGDSLLVKVARRLSASVPANAILARHGGDEFVALLPYETAEQVDLAAKALLASFLHPLLLGEHELHSTASIGVALFPDDGEDPDTLLRHADLAMYTAKAAGRDSMRFYTPQMNALVQERLKLEQDLYRALQEDTGQLLLHYQPQVDAQTGACIGCEALVRWQHPQRGMVMPGEFIQLAERSGLIVPLGHWVLTEACRQYVRWDSAGLALPISVNLSPVQLGRSDLPQSVQALFDTYGIPPGMIELELTESTLMDDSEENLGRFLALLELGCQFALDDFGTGYSSLSRLKRYPIGRLKIDRSFVQALPGNAEDSAVAKATLSLARDLGLEVVAEGVETLAQRDALLQLGCPVMQGYWFAKPMAADDFTRFRQRLSASIVS